MLQTGAAGQLSSSKPPVLRFSNSFGILANERSARLKEANGDLSDLSVFANPCETLSPPLSLSLSPSLSLSMRLFSNASAGSFTSVHSGACHNE